MGARSSLVRTVMLFERARAYFGRGDFFFVQIWSSLDFAAPVLGHSIYLRGAFCQGLLERLDLFALRVKSLVDFVHLATGRNVADFQKLFNYLSLPNRVSHGSIQQPSLDTHEFIGAENLGKARVRHSLQR